MLKPSYFFLRDNDELDKKTNCNLKKEKKVEWVEVVGYKGMRKDLKCMNDFQYEVGKKYQVEEKDTCFGLCGFHFSLNLYDVFSNYYFIEKGNRFFKVKGLIKKDDLLLYGRGTLISRTAVVAKEIEILEEVSDDELFQCVKENNLFTRLLYDLDMKLDYDTFIYLKNNTTKKLIEEKAEILCKELVNRKISKMFLNVVTGGLTEKEKYHMYKYTIGLDDVMEDKSLMAYMILDEKKKFN